MWPFLKVLNCITTEHDLRLVGLAVVICALASITAINLLHHVRGTNGHMRLVWLAVSATTTGFGIWATHFIAMLAFSPGIPNAYNILLTGISLIAAILLTGTGLAVALAPIRMGTWLGGAIVGGGIAAMHYIGMAAFEIQGPGGGVDRARRALRCGRAGGWTAQQQVEMEGRRRVAADLGDLQSPLHRDGRRLDHPRSDD